MITISLVVFQFSIPFFLALIAGYLTSELLVTALLIQLPIFIFGFMNLNRESEFILNLGESLKISPLLASALALVVVSVQILKRTTEWSLLSFPFEIVSSRFAPIIFAFIIFNLPIYAAVIFVFYCLVFGFLVGSKLIVMSSLILLGLRLLQPHFHTISKNQKLFFLVICGLSLIIMFFLLRGWILTGSNFFSVAEIFEGYTRFNGFAVLYNSFVYLDKSAPFLVFGEIFRWIPSQFANVPFPLASVDETWKIYAHGLTERRVLHVDITGFYAQGFSAFGVLGVGLYFLFYFWLHITLNNASLSALAKVSVFVVYIFSLIDPATPLTFIFVKCVLVLSAWAVFNAIAKMQKI